MDHVGIRNVASLISQLCGLADCGERTKSWIVIRWQTCAVFNGNTVQLGGLATKLYHITECTRAPLCPELPSQNLAAV